MPNMQMPLDFSTVADFKAIPAGVYAMVIDSAAYEEPKPGKSHGQLKVTYTITDGEQVNRSISDWMSFSPKAGFFMMTFWEGLGMVDPDTKQGPMLTFDEGNVLVDPQLAGMPVTVVIENHLYNNKEQNDFVSVTAMDEEPVPAPKARAMRTVTTEEVEDPLAGRAATGFRRTGAAATPKRVVR